MDSKAPLPIAWIEKIFMRLHGRFGKQFYDKFSLINEAGKDIGIENAKLVWAHELAGVSKERLIEGLKSTYDYPPSADDFLKRCAIKVKIQDYKALPAPHIDEILIKENIEKINQIAATMKQKNNYRDWVKPILANSKNYPDISLKIAKEVLNDENS